MTCDESLTIHWAIARMLSCCWSKLRNRTLVLRPHAVEQPALRRMVSTDTCCISWLLSLVHCFLFWHLKVGHGAVPKFSTLEAVFIECHRQLCFMTSPCSVVDAALRNAALGAGARMSQWRRIMQLTGRAKDFEDSAFAASLCTRRR